MRLRLMFAALTLPLAAPAAASIPVGSKAPDFTTQGALNGAVIRVHLAEKLRHGPVVLYFFPLAYTDGCNAEAKAFADSIAKFEAAGASVLGMSIDSVDTLQRFSKEHCAGKFPVATAAPAVLTGYDVKLQTKDGRTLASRTSYVIGRNGKIVAVHSDPAPGTHIAATLDAVRKLKSGR